MALQGPQKVAVLLCKFKDGPATEPHPEAYYRDLLARGTGGLNDYWATASLGAINLDGSQVFGWRTFDTDRDSFLAAHPGRWDKIQGALDQFPDVKAADYKAVVALYNVDVTDGGSQGGVLGGPADGNATFLAHELGHLFGLEHSFDTSQRQTNTWSMPGEYFDRQDIMSAMNVDADAGHRFSPRGPLINAPNLDRMGWLPPSRIWTPLKNSSDTYEVELVALGHAGRPGFLALRTSGAMAEFRVPEGFDSGLGQAAVLFHAPFADPNSVIFDAGGPDAHGFLPGQSFGSTGATPIHGVGRTGGTRITVLGFDLRRKTARLRVEVRAVRPPFATPDIIFGEGVGLTPQNGVLLVLQNGKLVPVPVPEPERLGDTALRDMVRAEVGAALREGGLAAITGIRTGRRPG